MSVDAVNETNTSPDPDRSQAHKLIHHGPERPFNCNYGGCHKSYKKDTHLKIHQIINHERDTSQQVITEVEECKEMYYNKYVLNQHVAACHREQGANSSKEKSEVEKNYKCNEPACDAAFNRSYRLKNHKITVHGGERPYRCDYEDCDKTYTNESHLVKHKSIRHSVKEINQHVAACHREQDANSSKKKSDVEKNQKCNEPGCDAAFNRSYRLKNHKITVHGGERPYRCDYEDCDKTYTNESHLVKHKSIRHSVKEINQHVAACHREQDANSSKKKSDGEKNHKCNEPGCDAAFNRPYRLKNHKITVHGGERPYRCDHEGCDKTYTNESHLVRHKNKSHCLKKIDRTEEVICDMAGCGRIFSNKYNLKRHISTNHTNLPFACQDCDEKFKWKGQFLTHQVEIHDQEAPYKCEKCPRVFIYYNLYNKHVKNHKTYQCDGEMKFDRRSKLLKHRKSECSVQVFTKKLAEEGKNGEIINDDNNVSGITQLGNRNVLAVNVDEERESPTSPIVKSLQSNIKKNVVDGKASSRDTAEKSDDDFKYINCPKKNCDKVLKSNKNLKHHLRIVHNGLPAKVGKPRRPRKNKGKSKKSMASILSSFEVGAVGNYENIKRETDEGRKEKALDEMECPSDWGCRDKIEEVDTLMDSQETTLDVVKSLPLSNKMTNTELKNCHERNPSITEASLESKFQVPERRRLLYNNDTINSSDNVINEKNCTKELAEGGKNGEIINDDNRVWGITQLGNNRNVLAVNVGEVGESPNSTIDKSFQSNIENNVFDAKASSRDTTEECDDDLLNLNTDTALLTSSENSCDSGIILFDFPELENIDGGDNLETVLNEVTVTQNVDRNDSYILDEEKLRKRLDVMLKDIFSLVKHLERDTN